MPKSSRLHYLLPDKRDSDILSKLWCPKIFQPLTVNTVRFRKSFLPYCLNNFSRVYCYDILYNHFTCILFHFYCILLYLNVSIRTLDAIWNKPLINCLNIFIHRWEILIWRKLRGKKWKSVQFMFPHDAIKGDKSGNWNWKQVTLK